MKDVVLLLDDEPHIRRDLGGKLERDGYSVHRAASVEEAKKIVLSEEIDFAIVDIKTDYESDFGGLQVASFVKRIRPRAKTIILSAHSLEDVESEVDAEAKSILTTLDAYIPKTIRENYITVVSEKLRELKGSQKPHTCFVIMPFSATQSCSEGEWTEIYEKLIKPAVEQSGFKYECKRAEIVYGNIIESILDELNRAEVVIADLTDRNPNVFYELGVRHALRNTTILIAQKEADLPFDLRPYATLIYNWKIEKDRDKLKAGIKRVLHLIETAPEEALSPVRKYLNL
jgi:response regulator RpfG family c-di-GMP phosphodiesterase